MPATAPPAHSGFGKGNLGLYVMIIVIGTSVCDKNYSFTIGTPVMAMAQRENRGTDLSVAGSNPSIFFKKQISTTFSFQFLLKSNVDIPI